MSGAILELAGLTKRFGGLVATDNVDLAITPGEIHAIIGPNGAGKTTLISQLSGEHRCDSGRILFAGHDITRLSVPRRAALGIGRSYQITSLFLEFSVLDNVALAIQIRGGHSFRLWRNARRDGALREPALALLESAGLAARADTRAADLSHGEQRQLEIAMTIARGAQLLLLDEPIAGMGTEESARMVEIIRGLKGRLSIVLVEHDMKAVFSLADRITVLVYGKVIATGEPAAIRANPEVQKAYFG